MTSKYCIYTDNFVEYSLMNKEHIIPLSLGGTNEFTIYVEKKFNSKVGSMIDGELSKDFFISLVRQKKNYKGHNKMVPETVWKVSVLKDTNSPIQVLFKNGGGMNIFNPISKKEESILNYKGKIFESKFGFNKFSRIVFTAKVLLSAGYFCYGETFKNYADHESLRKLMNLGISETKESIAKLPLKIVDIFYPISEIDKPLADLIKYACKVIDNSCVFFILSNDRIFGTVGIGGEFICTINFSATTMNFPNKDEFENGHVVLIKDSKLQRVSYTELNKQLLEILQKNN